MDPGLRLERVCAGGRGDKGLPLLAAPKPQHHEPGTGTRKQACCRLRTRLFRHCRFEARPILPFAEAFGALASGPLCLHACRCRPDPCGTARARLGPFARLMTGRCPKPAAPRVSLTAWCRPSCSKEALAPVSAGRGWVGASLRRANGPICPCAWHRPSSSKRTSCIPCNGTRRLMVHPLEFGPHRSSYLAATSSTAPSAFFQAEKPPSRWQTGCSPMS